MSDYDPRSSYYILALWSRLRRAIFRFIRGLEHPLDEPLHRPGLIDPEHENVIERLIARIRTAGSNMVHLEITPQLQNQAPVSLGGLFAKELLLASWEVESSDTGSAHHENRLEFLNGILRQYVYSDRDTFFATHWVLKEIASLGRAQK